MKPAEISMFITLQLPSQLGHGHSD